jgi:hypothetical protein
MRPRRQFFYLSAITLLAVVAVRALRRPPAEAPPARPAPTQPPPATRVQAAPAEAPTLAAMPLWLPLAQGAPEQTAPTPTIAPTAGPNQPIAPTAGPNQRYLPVVGKDLDPGDPPILGRPSGTAQQATDWLAARAAGYTPGEVTTIVADYARLGDTTGVDWFLALAQLAHETASMTSWWSQPPRRNPAGIGVTGATRPGVPDTPPGAGWTWDGTQWREGLSFASWLDDAAPAHLGRLLAYALTDTQANQAQRALIERALSYRPLPASYRGVAPTILGLNGRWAVPGTQYGQSIIALARRMRQ